MALRHRHQPDAAPLPGGRAPWRQRGGVEATSPRSAGPRRGRALGPELAAALRTVAAGDRDALLLHAWADLTYTEIAAATGVPVGTVRSRIHRARTLLRAHLEDKR